MLSQEQTRLISVEGWVLRVEGELQLLSTLNSALSTEATKKPSVFFKRLGPNLILGLAHPAKTVTCIGERGVAIVAGVVVAVVARYS